MRFIIIHIVSFIQTIITDAAIVCLFRLGAEMIRGAKFCAHTVTCLFRIVHLFGNYQGAQNFAALPDGFRKHRQTFVPVRINRLYRKQVIIF